MKSHISTWAVAAALLLAAAGPARAQVQFDDIPWVQGPAVGDLGDEAQVNVPEGCLFTARKGTEMFMELTENTVSDTERGTALCGLDAEPWFAVFSYSSSGYVKDDERDALDADALLESLRSGNEAGNRERRKRGWATLELEGWVSEPYYDAETNNLTWALTAATSAGGRSVNHSVRVLGRGGVMHVDLVSDPEQLAAAMATFNQMVGGFGYNAGHTYAEWREGDKLAEYGLTALIAGGAGVAAAKSGLLGKLWKLIVAGVAAALAGVKRMFGRKEKPATAQA